jgi:hypothetical protein
MDLADGAILLEPVGQLDEERIQQFAALNVATFEDLIGFIHADPEGVADYLDLEPEAIPEFEASMLPDMRPLLLMAEMFEAAPPSEYPLGLILHDDDADSTVSDETFGSLLAAYRPDKPIGPQGQGVDYRDRVRPVRDQGGRGTCAAHAVGAILEYQHARKKKVPIDYSPQFLFWASKQRDGIPSEDATFIETATDVVVDTGDCEEEVWPYNPDPIPGNVGHAPPPDDAEYEARQHRATQRVEIERRSSRAFREVLDGGNLVAFGVPFYSNTYRSQAFNTRGIFLMPSKKARRLRLGHAMCAVGYQYDNRRPGGGFFIVKNSWGPNFGERSPIEPGYVLMPFAYIDALGDAARTLVL